MGVRPACIPEYGIDLGPGLDPLPADTGGCCNPTWNVYALRSAKGLVLVNPPAPDQTVTLPGPMWRVDPRGGSVSSDGSAPRMLRLHRCAICAAWALLLNVRPTSASAA